MDLECPYCEKEMDDPDDCYEPDMAYEHECGHCGKNFVFYVEYARSYSANKAECLNGGEHRYKEHTLYGTGDPPRVLLRCQDCGHEVPNARNEGGER